MTTASRAASLMAAALAFLALNPVPACGGQDATASSSAAAPATIDSNMVAARLEGDVFVPAAQDASPPAQPPHTGIRALVGTLGSDFKAFPRRRSTWVILGLGAAGALGTHPLDNSANAHLAGSSAAGRLFTPGKWMGSVYAQAGTAVGLYLVGRYVLPHAEGEPKTNKVSHIGFDLIRAQILSQALVQGMKYIGQRDRPTGECCAFPSGHAAAAFATASVLERHFGYRGAWPTLAAAAYVGASRLHDNRHFLSDVVFGSAVGIASGWTVVGRHGHDNYTVVPATVPGGIAILVVRSVRLQPDNVLSRF